MIDYEKLRIAHELAIKNSEELMLPSFIAIRYLKGHYDFQFYTGSVYESFNSLDPIIERLEQLTKPEPKYDEGSTVYWLFDKVTYEGKIDAVFYDEKGYRYQIQMDNGDINLHEDQLYPTKQALIDSQIEYWQKLKVESFEPKFEGEVVGFKYKPDNLKNADGFYFMHEVAGNKYYKCTTNNEVYCACGVEADFPHECNCEHEPSAQVYLSDPPKYKCTKCGEFY